MWWLLVGAVTVSLSAPFLMVTGRAWSKRRGRTVGNLADKMHHAIHQGMNCTWAGAGQQIQVETGGQVMLVSDTR